MLLEIILDKDDIKEKKNNKVQVGNRWKMWKKGEMGNDIYQIELLISFLIVDGLKCCKKFQ